MHPVKFEEEDFLACCGGTKFAKEMASLSPFANWDAAVAAAKDTWFNKVDVTGWLEAVEWSKNEQSTAVATATSSTLEELADWNAHYRQKFGFVFLICASGKNTSEILEELKRRYLNRPIVEFEIAAHEQMKITELHLSRLLADKLNASTTHDQSPATASAKAGEAGMTVIGAHLDVPASERSSQVSTQARPPVTTQVLDIGRGCPAFGIEVRLEIWKGKSRPSFEDADLGSWILLGSGMTDKDGRSGQLMSITNAADPGIYRISFNTGKCYPMGFFPFVSIVFQIKESQKLEHFHVPLLLSPFGYSTYRGS